MPTHSFNFNFIKTYGKRQIQREELVCSIITISENATLRNSNKNESLS